MTRGVYSCVDGLALQLLLSVKARRGCDNDGEGSGSFGALRSTAHDDDHCNNDKDVVGRRAVGWQSRVEGLVGGLGSTTVKVQASAERKRTRRSR